MTGLERLRNITDELDRGPWLGDVTRALYDTARQIEREQAELSEKEKLADSYKDALNGVCKALGLTDGTGLPEMGEIICAEIDARLMPHGMEWPRFEDGEKVRFGDEYVVDSLGLTGEVYSIKVDEDGEFELNETQFCKGERVERPKQDTHTKPEPPDSWEQIENDATKAADEISSAFCGDDYSWARSKISELVRRAKALAERDKAE